MRSLWREFVKILFQRRTYVGWAGLLAVPLLIVLALDLSNSKPGPGEGPPFFAQIINNGVFVPLAAIGALSFFLFPLIAAMAGAYPLAGEAEMGTMKTWMSRPLGRSTVLFSKWGVAILYVVVGMALVGAGGLLAGWLVFGAHPLITLSGATISIPSGIGRIVLANGLILAALLCMISLALFVSTLTNSSLTAAITTMVIYVVLNILNGFHYFDFMKPYTFTSYSLTFENLFRVPIYWHPIRTALLAYGVTVAALLVGSWLVFRRKDILT
jgi:ABC-2 type transport system permease protein